MGTSVPNPLSAKAIIPHSTKASANFPAPNMGPLLEQSRSLLQGFRPAMLVVGCREGGLEHFWELQKRLLSSEQHFNHGH